MEIMRKVLPGKLCWACGEFDPGIRIVLALVMLFRLVATMIGCAYGPYLYLVLPLGGLYLAADALLLYAIWKALAAVRPDDPEEDIDDDASYKFPKPEKVEEEDEESSRCDFPTVKVWIAGWLSMNAVAVLGIAVCIGLIADLGTWTRISLGYSPYSDPIHMGMFVVIIILEALLIWMALLLCSLYLMLRDHWMMSLMGNKPIAPSSNGLTQGGQRIKV